MVPGGLGNGSAGRESVLVIWSQVPCPPCLWRLDTWRRLAFGLPALTLGVPLSPRTDTSRFCWKVKQSRF